MNTPDWPNDDPLEILLENRLKHWAKSQRPPRNGRRNLLAAAEIAQQSWGWPGLPMHVHRRNEYRHQWRCDATVSYLMFAFQTTSLKLVI